MVVVEEEEDLFVFNDTIEGPREVVENSEGGPFLPAVLQTAAADRKKIEFYICLNK